jgi:hypothetical protein
MIMNKIYYAKALIEKLNNDVLLTSIARLKNCEGDQWCFTLQISEYIFITIFFGCFSQHYKRSLFMKTLVWNSMLSWFHIIELQQESGAHL